MSVPSNIVRLLDDNNVPYSLTELVLPDNAHPVVELKAYNMARAVVMECRDKTKLIVVSRSDTLLDIQRINHLYERNFEPLTGPALEAFLQKSGASSVPALPMLNKIPSVVDEGLLNYDTVYLDIGIGNQFIKLAQSNFRELLGDAKIDNIVASLSALEAPSNPEHDHSSIEKSVSLFTQLRIKQRLEDTLEFPPLPATADKIIRLRVNPHADISDLTDIVEIDASLSAQVVSWAASPYYSAPGAIKSIHDAIVRVLGFDMVLNLALGLSLGNALKMPKDGPHGCMPYFQQSVYVAAAMEALVTCIPRDYRPGFGTAYLSGLLNNFGYLVIAEVFPGQFKAICQHIDANPQASVQATERHIVGVDRNQLASWLMELWHMPATVCHALRHQNDPSYEGEGHQYALLLYIAKKLLQESGLSMGVASAPISNTTFERLQLDPEKAREAIATLMDSSEELAVIAKQMSGE